MNRRALLFSCALALPLAGCGDETVTRRIRVIAKAEVAGKPVEGSTVMEFTWRGTSDGRMYIDTVSEALILDLDGRATLYLLNKAMAPDGRWAGSWAYMVLRTLGIPGQGNKKDFPKLEAAAGRFPVTGLGAPDLPPVFVAFSDETRKASIYRVKPEEFGIRFGSDVKWIGMEFEFTDDPVTDKLADRLPMLVESDPKNTFPYDPPGTAGPFGEWAFEKKVSEDEFFKGKRGFP